MSDNKLLLLRGHIDAMKCIGGDMEKISTPAKAVELLRTTEHDETRSEGNAKPYRVGFETTVLVVSCFNYVAGAIKAASQKKALSKS